ncbi:hypothetical protein [Endozoicomonas ascidiicola]|uniref:hypothetical protein n=1 Tax=Endozoicomonas ascidiicola TaxID=1698521 RepID=UPI0008361822|nr:hypothetical protein [Endozoicomonas ascidiicola]
MNLKFFQISKVRKVASSFLIFVSILLLGGCYSLGKKVGELRAAIYSPIYEAELSYFSDKAVDEAVQFCLNELEEKQEAEPSEASKKCVAEQYEIRMNYYMSQSVVNRSRQQSNITSQPGSGQKIYGTDECIGAVVNGVCHGSIAPKAGYKKTCYGQMINGQCTGAMF